MRIKSQATILDVFFDSDMMRIRLLDGKELSIPIMWFPKLRDAKPEQREKWRLIGRGIGIHWEELDEDISAESLLNLNLEGKNGTNSNYC
ncbi:MAG TPA: DUF2442 domain-containing protein [Caldisericia bacterium]|nr:DUF2442 domain-containing protein [Caldisericia bacterium]